MRTRLVLLRHRQSIWNSVTRVFEHRIFQSAVLRLIAHGNWMVFTPRYVVNCKRRQSTKDRTFARVLKEFGEASDCFAVASMAVHVVETPAFDMRLDEQRKIERFEKNGHATQNP
jgi:hypothetical protein